MLYPSVIACDYSDPKSLNSRIQAYLLNADRMECRCGDVMPVTGYVTYSSIYCGHECTFSPGRWCIDRYLSLRKDRMRVYPLTIHNNHQWYVYIYTVYIGHIHLLAGF